MQRQRVKLQLSSTRFRVCTSLCLWKALSPATFREECCNALERHIAGEGYNPERAVLTEEHREGLSAPIHEIGSNVLPYNCFGFDSMTKREVAYGSLDDSNCLPNNYLRAAKHYPPLLV